MLNTSFGIPNIGRMLHTIFAQAAENVRVNTILPRLENIASVEYAPQRLMRLAQWLERKDLLLNALKAMQCRIHLIKMIRLVFKALARFWCHSGESTLR